MLSSGMRPAIKSLPPLRGRSVPPSRGRTASRAKSPARSKTPGTTIPIIDRLQARRESSVPLDTTIQLPKRSSSALPARTSSAIKPVKKEPDMKPTPSTASQKAIWKAFSGSKKPLDRHTRNRASSKLAEEDALPKQVKKEPNAPVTPEPKARRNAALRGPQTCNIDVAALSQSDKEVAPKPATALQPPGTTAIKRKFPNPPLSAPAKGSRRDPYDVPSDDESLSPSSPVMKTRSAPAKAPGPRSHVPFEIPKDANVISVSSDAKVITISSDGDSDSDLESLDLGIPQQPSGKAQGKRSAPYTINGHLSIVKEDGQSVKFYPEPVPGPVYTIKTSQGSVPIFRKRGTSSVRSSSAASVSKTTRKSPVRTTSFTPINSLKQDFGIVLTSQPPTKFGSCYSNRVRDVFSDSSSPEPEGGSSESAHDVNDKEFSPPEVDDASDESVHDINDKALSPSLRNALNYASVRLPAMFEECQKVYVMNYLTNEHSTWVADGAWEGLITDGPYKGQYTDDYEPPDLKTIEEWLKTAERRHDSSGEHVSDSESCLEDASNQDKEPLVQHGLRGYLPPSLAPASSTCNTMESDDSATTSVMIERQFTQETAEVTPPSNQGLGVILSSAKTNSSSKKVRIVSSSSSESSEIVPARLPVRTMDRHDLVFKAGQVAQEEDRLDENLSVAAKSPFKSHRCPPAPFTPRRHRRHKSSKGDLCDGFADADLDVTPDTERAMSEIATPSTQSMSSRRKRTIEVEIHALPPEKGAEYEKIVDESDVELPIKTFEELNGKGDFKETQDSGIAAVNYMLDISPEFLNNVTELSSDSSDASFQPTESAKPDKSLGQVEPTVPAESPEPAENPCAAEPRESAGSLLPSMPDDEVEAYHRLVDHKVARGQRATAKKKLHASTPKAEKSAKKLWSTTAIWQLAPPADVHDFEVADTVFVAPHLHLPSEPALDGERRKHKRKSGHKSKNTKNTKREGTDDLLSSRVNTIVSGAFSSVRTRTAFHNSHGHVEELPHRKKRKRDTEHNATKPSKKRKKGKGLKQASSELPEPSSPNTNAALHGAHSIDETFSQADAVCQPKKPKKPKSRRDEIRSQQDQIVHLSGSYVPDPPIFDAQNDGKSPPLGDVMAEGKRPKRSKRKGKGKDVGLAEMSTEFAESQQDCLLSDAPPLTATSELPGDSAVQGLAVGKGSNATDAKNQHDGGHKQRKRAHDSHADGQGKKVKKLRKLKRAQLPETSALLAPMHPASITNAEPVSVHHDFGDEGSRDKKQKKKDKQDKKEAVKAVMSEGDVIEKHSKLISPVAQPKPKLPARAHSTSVPGFVSIPTDRRSSVLFDLGQSSEMSKKETKKEKRRARRRSESQRRAGLQGVFEKGSRKDLLTPPTSSRPSSSEGLDLV